MDRDRPVAADVLMKVIPPLAAWAVTKLLERPKVKEALERVDRAGEARVKKAKKNASANRMWIAAGAAAFVVCLGLIANAARKR